MVVFIDNGLPWHNDFVHWGSERPKYDEYVDILGKFFDTLNKEVVVALHPVSPDKVYPWKSVFGHTEDLIKESEYVISHVSRSLYWAVENYKPIVFILTDLINKMHHIGVWSHRFAKFLDKKPIFIDKEYVVDLSLNKERYDLMNSLYKEFRPHPTQHTMTDELFIQMERRLED